MRSKGKALCLFFSFLSLLILPGCWDRQDIEETYLEVGDALDQVEESTTPDNDEQKKKPFALTVQYLLPEIMAGKGGQGQKPYENITQIGDSVAQMSNQFYLQLDRSFSAHHLKVVVIGEELARHYNLQQLLIDYARAPEVRGSSLVMISMGRASDLFQMTDPAIIPSFQLFEIANHQKTADEILPPMTLQKVSGKMAGDSSFLLQSVISEKGELRFTGAAVIKGKSNKLIGFLNKEELKAFNLLTGEAKLGTIEAVDQKTKQLVAFESKSVKSNIQPHVQGDKIWFDVKIEVEGALHEDWVIPGNAFDNKFLKGVEDMLEQKVKQQVDHILNKIQNDYQTDVAGFGNRLRIQEPQVWKKVKKDWDQQFSKSPVKLHTKINIRDYGTKGTKEKE